MILEARMKKSSLKTIISLSLGFFLIGCQTTQTTNNQISDNQLSEDFICGVVNQEFAFQQSREWARREGTQKYVQMAKRYDQ